MAIHVIAPILKDISAAETKEQLWQTMLDHFHDRGIAMVSYHAVNSDGTPLAITADGFPQEWVCEYIEKNLVSVDPIPELAAKLSKPFFWRDISTLVTQTPKHQSYLAMMERARLGDGLAFYVFGPAFQNAYVGLGFGVDQVELDRDTVFSFQCMAQAGHLRFCALNETCEDLEPLTPREREVLEWVARGKSNSVIAEIVGISVHTVDAHIRGIYRKLGVNDRTSAAIRGLGRGLVRLAP